ncbi:MAG: hypothetical protein ACOX7F_05820 [Eubacteriales bacterium]|jgi:hypothetical protein
MRRNSCFFIGHREASKKIYPNLLAEIERHIVELGVTEFIVGHYGGFDRLATQAVLAAKQVHADVGLSLLLPYYSPESSMGRLDDFDHVYYPPGMETVPRRLAIVKANRYLVDHVDYLIAYAWHPASNALQLLEYAQKRAQKGLLTVTVLQGG